MPDVPAHDRELYELTRPHYEAFVAFTEDPRAHREALWRTVLGEISEGRMYSKQLRGRSFVPLDEFELTRSADYQTFIEPALRERLSPLTGQPILYWARSSGTTSANSKFMPFTPATLDRFKRIELSRIHDDLRKFPGDVARYRQIRLNGLWPEPHPSTGIPIGLLTAFAHTFQSDAVAATRAIPYEAYRDNATFKRWAPLYALAAHARVLMAVTPAPITALLQDTFANLKELWPYLAGEKSPPAGLPPVVVDEGRLEIVRAAMELSTPRASDVWPSLKVVSCWMTGACAPLVEELRPLVGTLPFLQLGYGCTEGVIAQPSPAPDVMGGPVSNFGIVEFIPGGAEAKASSIVQPWELKVGERYTPVITNPTGVVRFHVEDLVECVGFFNKVPRVQFVQRSDSAIAMEAGFFLEEDLLAAIDKAQLKLQGRWLFAPRGDNLGLELVHDASLAPEVFERLDRALSALHITYGECRADGSFEAFRGRKIPPEHPFWVRFEPKHAQSKRAVLVKEPVTL